MAVLTTDGRQLGDLLMAEGDAVVTRASRLLTNDTEEEVTLPVGYPLDVDSETTCVLLVAAGIANCNALLLDAVTLAVDQVAKVPLLVRGPAGINEDKLPTVDYLGAAINKANFKAAIVANIPVISLLKESPTQASAEA